ncbi:MAG: hypothetical protein ACRENB_13280 [Gemmatimonadales bacterium]
MKRLQHAMLGLFAVLAAACEEKLATPADCPTLCPGTSLEIFDTVLVASVQEDSAYDGYLSIRDVPSLLVSDDLPEREARSFLQYPDVNDSVQVGGVNMPYRTDSLAFTFVLEGRDPAARGLTLYLHRIVVGVDSATTFEAIESQLTPATLLDSVAVSDTARSGTTARIVLSEAELEKIVPLPEDSGKVAVALRVAGDRPTGLRFGSNLSVVGTPALLTYAFVNVPDTSQQKRTLSVGPEFANYAVQGGEPRPPPDILFVGTRRGVRSIIRFDIPPALRDSITVLRATLELTPTGSIPGLTGDPASLQVRGIVADLGAKSPTLVGFGAAAQVLAGTTGVVSVDVREIVSLWFIASPAPTVLFIGLFPEGGSFTLPEFFSTRSGAGAPRLRLTYAKPTQPGHP